MSENKVENAESTGKVELTAFFGVKAGMTRIFDENGNHVPVTVIKLIPNVISQVKTKDKDNYDAYQIAFYEKRPKLITKPIKGHLAKASINDRFFARFSEIRIEENAQKENLGKELSFASFAAKSFVDVTGISKGKGFQGVIKRYHFRGGPAAHGSHFHRHPGAIGNRATPARVFPEKKMPGHMGCDKVTIQNQVVADINLEKGYLLIRGVVPGPKNGIVKIAKALKKSK